MSFGRLGTLSLSKLGAPGGSKFDIYSILGLGPGFVADFDGEYYRAATADSTFSGAITHAATSNATMTDSDGYIKWRPHNLLTYSEQFDNAAWLKLNVTVTANAATAPDGTSTADQLTQSVVSSTTVQMAQTFTITLGVKYTYSIFIKQNDCSDFIKILVGHGNQGSGFGLSIDPSDMSIQYANAYGSGYVYDSSSVVDKGNGWYKVSITGQSDTISSVAAYVGFNDSATGGHPNDRITNGGTGSIYIWGAHLYRSDLGGMAPVPTDAQAFSGATTYVPTTTAAKYLPRRGHYIYDGVSAWVNEGVFHESEARTNLITYSEDFTNASWGKTNTDTLAIDATGPDGQTSAVTLVDSGLGGTGGIYLTYAATVSTTTTYTFSVYAKADQLSSILLYLGNFTTPASNGYFFNLTDGTTTAYSGTPAMTPLAEDCGNGWWRCSLTFTTDAADTSGSLQMYVADGTAITIDLDGTSSILIYGAQFEAGATPSSYIPTSGATATRAAETLTIPIANLPWSATNVSIQMDGRVTYADDESEVKLVRWYNSSSNRIEEYWATTGANTGQFRTLQIASGTADTVTGTTTDYSPGVNVSFNMATRHGSTFINGAIEGTALTEDTTPVALPDLSATNLELGYDYMGTIKTFRVWDVDLGDAGIEAAST